MLFVLSKTLFFGLRKILLKNLRGKKKLVVHEMDVSRSASHPFFFFFCYTVNNQDGLTVFLLHNPKLHLYTSLGITMVSSLSNWNRVLQQK